MVFALEIHLGELGVPACDHLRSVSWLHSVMLLDVPVELVLFH
jgi:hypothetical protein